MKTPLSVIQSCLAILKDGVASHKRDHYFCGDGRRSQPDECADRGYAGIGKI
ncbi:hypothetical protein ACFSQ7_12490 [Paenibacillus rhizoplanae]